MSIGLSVRLSGWPETSTFLPSSQLREFNRETEEMTRERMKRETPKGKNVVFPVMIRSEVVFTEKKKGMPR